jgi:hypothetical protein
LFFLQDPSLNAHKGTVGEREGNQQIINNSSFIHVQVGASLCLARVIECTKDPNTGTLQRLCPRILKLLSSPSFLANASLLPAIGGLAQVLTHSDYQLLLLIAISIDDISICMLQFRQNSQEEVSVDPCSQSIASIQSNFHLCLQCVKEWRYNHLSVGICCCSILSDGNLLHCFAPLVIL